MPNYTLDLNVPEDRQIAVLRIVKKAMDEINVVDVEEPIAVLKDAQGNVVAVPWPWQ